ncbi:uracil-DNA glycosylase [Flavobacterium nackdongense]|uniref:Uracil-DNA glycosylase n=1 Tax=Flavobacterium nackdongense TaxID=2547394 RepID=A0A4P6Y9T1_9FLAO|nr:uracil-DNA glycosylase [Flavobacterium nackdongense]QBN17365.1 uracil-DNA glycosylase [Flavobacterium nackdongense]
MNPNLNPSWQTILSDEIQKPYFRNLMKAVDEEYQNHTCFPPKELIFAAFEHCSFQDLKVVIIGQDPYHGTNEANGLCFSVNDGIKIPPSLRNIFREMNEDLGTVFFPISGNLEPWAKQGILLLNASLTVRKDSPNSHKHLQWNVFTDAVIQKISDQKEQIVFLLWGSFAQKKGSKIDRIKHLVLESGHPSPMSANQGKWFGNRHFSKINLYLNDKGIGLIDWSSNQKF